MPMRTSRRSEAIPMADLEPNSGPAHRCKHGNDWLTCDACEKASRATAHFAADPDNTSPEATARQWIIQRCINAFRNEYEDWPGYCERLLNRPEMMAALYECEERWPEHEFRGHNVANQKPGRDRLRVVQ
jgi:hypothetical protein